MLRFSEQSNFVFLMSLSFWFKKVMVKKYNNKKFPTKHHAMLIAAIYADGNNELGFYSAILKYYKSVHSRWNYVSRVDKEYLYNNNNKLLLFSKYGVNQFNPAFCLKFCISQFPQHKNLLQYDDVIFNCCEHIFYRYS